MKNLISEDDSFVGEEHTDKNSEVMAHLISPGYKPVQVTQDLKSFWQTTYHDVRKELRMRYPKHSWPEDPWTAQAVRGVKRRGELSIFFLTFY